MTTPEEEAGDPGVAAEGEWPPPFGALTGRMPSIEIEDIQAARHEALLGNTRASACASAEAPSAISRA